MLKDHLKQTLTPGIKPTEHGADIRVALSSREEYVFQYQGTWTFYQNPCNYSLRYGLRDEETVKRWWPSLNIFRYHMQSLKKVETSLVQYTHRYA
jgi:hypothetical protein